MVLNNGSFVTRPAFRRWVALAAVTTAACPLFDNTAGEKPAAVRAVSGENSSAMVGTALASPPAFTITDESGNALGDVAVTVTVASGGGTLTGAPKRSASGPTSVGTWTLGTTAGPNTLTVSVSGLAPLTITATGTPGSPAKIVAVATNAKTARAGDVLSTATAFTVQDKYGNGVTDQSVSFAVTAGGGSVSPGTATTTTSGVASTTWRLGNRGGPQTLTVTSGTSTTTFDANIQSSFTLDLRFFGPTMSVDAQTAFTNAANRIRAAIVGQISTVGLAGADLARCGMPGLTGTLNESTSGVIIYASVAPIDGAGKVLAQAGPCFVRQTSVLPAVGIMKFDEADIQTYITSGRFESVVLHEMNHVVGFGTIWEDKNLLQNAVYADTTLTGSTNPRYMGAAAINQCAGIPGVSTNHCNLSAGIAVEQCGTAGTADGHWREMFTSTCTGSDRRPSGGSAAFDLELMTGYAESTPTMPWSVMSIAQFQDLGYSVNLLAADSFTIPNLMTLARLQLAMAASVDEGPIEHVLRPRFAIGDGSIKTLPRGMQR